MTRKFKPSGHYCKTPVLFKSGRWKCPKCHTVYQWKVSNRTDRHGRPLKGDGYWQQITQ